MKHPKHSNMAIHEMTVWQKGVSAFLGVALVATMIPALSNSAAFAEGNAADTVGAEVSTTGELIVVYEDEALSLDESVSVATASADRSLEEIGVVDQTEIVGVDTPESVVAVVELADGVDEMAALSAIQELDGVESVHPNYEYSMMDVVSDPYAIEDATAAQNQYYLYATKATEAWSDAQTDGAVTVAVLDTGCNLFHEDLADRVDAQRAYDATQQQPLMESGLINGGDANGHGTQVAGVIAAQADNALGIAGVSYNANILPIRVFDDKNVCTSADLLAAYDYLDKLIEEGEAADLKVINLSLGYYADTLTEADELLRQAISDMRNEHDVLTICAGGNGDKSGNPRTTNCYPADFEECISVTALDEEGANASFSDYNASKDISAPGVNIFTTDATGYTKATGTSMAAPIVSGAAALLWASDPALTSAQIIDALSFTADDVEGNAHPESGSAGALNIAAALRSVLGIDDSTNATSTPAEGEEAPEVPGGFATEEEANENAVMGSSQFDQEFAPEVVEESGMLVDPTAPSSDTDEALESQEMAAEGEEGDQAGQVANSWRFQDGELLEPEQMNTDGDEGIQLFSIVNNGGFNMFNSYDAVGGACPSSGAAKGIDVSEHNGTINWAAVKAAGVDFAIIRCGYGDNYTSQDDKQWVNNVNGCIANGIPFGVYIYSYAKNTTMASSEADHVIRCLSAVNRSMFVLPVYFDMEDASTIGSDYAGIAQTFCTKVKAAGYDVGIYANTNWFNNYLTNGIFDSYKRWVAAYNTTGLSYSKFNTSTDIWQFSSAGSISGISGRVDLNYSHMTGFKQPTTAVSLTATLSSDQKTITVRGKGGWLDVAKSVQYPTWSTVGGQDDLRWYNATKSGSEWVCSIPVSNHKSAGAYNIHAYAMVLGIQKAVGAANTVTVTNPAATVAITQTADQKNRGVFTITATVTSCPSGVSKIQLPTWSSAGGQDDLVWYTPTAKGNNVWQIEVPCVGSNRAPGSYISHAYITCGNGLFSYAGATTQTVSLSAASLTAKLSTDQKSVTITGTGGYYTMATSVLFPTWGMVSGQNDLVWYTAKKSGSSWTVTIPISSHKEAGVYAVHGYAMVSGKQTFVSSATFTVDNPKASVVISQTADQKNRGVFTAKVTVTSCPAGVTLLQLPVWSSAGGQDDLVWYAPKAMGNNVWQLEIPCVSSNRAPGSYIAHAYVTSGNGVFSYAGATTQTVALSNATLTAKLSADQKSITVTGSGGYYNFATAVHFPTWGMVGGQNDLVWYSAKKSGSSWTVTIPVSSHKEAGVYALHAYGMISGTQRFINSATVTVAAPTAKVEVTESSKGHYQVTVSGITCASGVAKVQVPTWTSKNGQDDLVWHSAARQADGTYKINIYSTQHKNEVGAYISHVYITGGNGIMSYVGAANHTMV